MKTKKNLIYIIPFLFFLLMVSSCPVSASENDKIYYCSTADELYDTLTFHPGSTIYLTDTIEWNFYSDTMEVSDPTVIYTGEYGIHIQENGYFHVKGPVSFYGTGSSTPLFLVEGYLSTSAQTTISASGEDCTAVQISGEGIWDSDLTTVTACGENATAVFYGAGPESRLTLAQIMSQGTGSKSLYTERPLQTILCAITNEGGSVSSGTVPVSMYGCHVQPVPPELLIYDCNAALYDRPLQNYGYCYPIGTTSNIIIETFQTYSFTSDNGFEFTYDIPVRFDGVKDIYPEAGTYSITVTPVVPDWFPISLPPMEMALNIIAPDQPYLFAAYELMDSIGIQFFSEITDADSITIYYSADDGETWRDIMELPGSYVYFLGAQVIGLPKDKSYLFCLDVKGGSMEGISNILRFSYGKLDIDGGGDNDGGDRTDQELPSYEQDPPDTGSEPGTEISGSENPPTDAGSTPPGNTSSDAETVPSKSAASQSGITHPGDTSSGTDAVPPKSAASQAEITHPRNTPSQSGSAADTSEALLEQVTETSTIISGARLRLLLQSNPDTVLFEKDGITVEIPSSFLSSLHLPDHAFLKISIQQTNSVSFSLFLNADGDELDTLEETTITMPFTPSGDREEEQFTLIHVDTGSKNTAKYMSDQGRVSSKIYKTGTYTLQYSDGHLPDSPQNSKTGCIILLMTAVILCTSAAVILFLRKRRIYHEKY